MARALEKGKSIHIGLNGVDPNQYNGWPGTLSGCINDANSMHDIADSLGYDTTMLTDADATAQAVLDALSEAANSCTASDLLLLTYSGHGGQVDDVSGDEPDSQDETWVLYDRMLIDDEIYAALANFEAGVRIFVLSDSCHSGTVLRDVYTQLPQFTPLAREYKIRAKRGKAMPETLPIELRRIPADVQNANLSANKAKYARVKRAARAAADPQASTILISGCQDNQLSADGNKNGLFTETLLKVWGDGGFEGDYPTFRQKIVAKMPATQSPNYFTVGTPMPEFEAQKPFTVEAPVSTPSTGKPSVTGPASVDRSDDPPTFDVVTGANQYYVFEITSDTSRFADSNRSNDDTFYGSWDDSSGPARYTDSTYTLPQDAWDRLKQADQLWFRIGTTSSESDWDNYSVSTEDGEGDSAPSLQITGAGADAVPNDGERPSVTGPASVDRSDDPPTFDVVTGANQYYVFEITSDTSRFADSNRSNDDTFYGSWDDSSGPARYTDSTYTLPQDAWDRLKQADQLWFRIGTTSSESDWDNYSVSTEDGEGDSAPSLQITGERVFAAATA